MTEPRKPIVVVGSANMDYVVRVAHLPRAGETVPGEDLVTTFGGKGANAAVAAARLGGCVQLVGCVGNDAAAGQYMEHLEVEGVKTEHVRRSPTRPTGSALILVDQNAENVIAVAPGANYDFCTEDIAEVQAVISGAAVLLCQFEVPLDCVRAAIQHANQVGVPVVLNPSPLRMDFDWSGIVVNYLVVNEGEAQALGCTSSAGRRSSDGNYRNVVITRGSASTLYHGDDGAGEIKAYAVDCVDTVGAGDTFAGALVVALSEGVELAPALRFANAAGALATTRTGAQASMPTRAEVESLIGQSDFH
jgi:ribokinase